MRALKEFVVNRVTILRNIIIIYYRGGKLLSFDNNEGMTGSCQTSTVINISIGKNPLFSTVCACTAHARYMHFCIFLHARPTSTSMLRR